VKIGTILDFIDSGDIALPEFQRGYVWNRDQVRGLFASLYAEYPVGGFMMWNTAAGDVHERGGSTGKDGSIKLLLDGQQRATTLYGVLRGRAPRFFQGNDRAFTGLHFNVLTKTFEFYAASKMKDASEWIDVSDLFRNGSAPHLARVSALADGDTTRLGELFNRITTLERIRDRDVHLDEVTGPDKTIDVVVDIFNRVNSGGTKLSKGDLALAKICAAWPTAREEMNKALADWSAKGLNFSLDWLLRVINAVVTGKAPFVHLAERPVADLKEGLHRSVGYVDMWINLIAGRLGLDHDRVLFSKPALVVLARHTHLASGAVPSSRDQGRLLAWFVHTGMWGRYAGSTETVLAQDLDAVERGGIDELFRLLTLSRGDLRVRPDNFAGSSLGARFYPILYMLTRVRGARDFGSGLVLSSTLLGRLSRLEVHHIFPKALLYAAGYARGEVNAVANYCLLTQGSNLKISATPPSEYMPKVEQHVPGALASQWAPADPALWDPERYLDFLAARRELLAEAANDLLDGLQAGDTLEGPASSDALIQPSPVDESAGKDEREAEVDELVTWITEQGYAAPSRDVEICHPDSGRVLSLAEAYWPGGIQDGLGQPIVLELDDDGFDEDALTALGHLVFTSLDAVREHVNRLG
jgi:hypothetical protein